MRRRLPVYIIKSCCLSWPMHGLPQYNEMTLQKLQNCAFRRILALPRVTLGAYTHEQLNMDRLSVWRFKHVYLMVFQILNGLAPEKLSNMFKYVHGVSNKETRQSSKKPLYLDKPHLELIKRSFRGACYRNSPRVHIRDVPSLDSFKSAFCDYLAFAS